MTTGNGSLTASSNDLHRRYDVLRLQWTACRAAKGRADGSATVAVSGAASDATCAASGWIRFDIAATTALAADEAIAKDDAWILWAADQAAAWSQ